MGIISGTLSLLSRRRLGKFDKASLNPAACQTATFQDLIRRASRTQWGRRYGYRDIRTPEQFRKVVPVTDYEASAKMWHKAFEGACDVTWPGHVRYFAMSSGTTAGNKYLPVTRDAIRSNMRSGALLVAFLAARGGVRNLAAGKFLYLGGCTTLKRQGQSFTGDASAIVALHMPFYARRRSLPQPDIAVISNWEEKIARVVDRYLTANVCVLSACPSWAALLFKQMLHAAEQRSLPAGTIGELWPQLSHFVSYGMAFGPYRRAFEEYLGRDVHYVDTYSSSEAGMTAIQAEPGGPMRMILDNGVFYEFVPADRAGAENPPRLHIGEVETGRDYALIVSTNGGIWSYPLGDLVRFESLSPPSIVFVGRTRVDLSAFGEHVTGEMIENAVAAACEKTSAIVADYTICPRFPSPSHPRPAHRWLVEFDRTPRSDAAFVEALDESIRAVNEDYDTHRAGDFGLELPILIRATPRTFYTWMKLKGKLGGQNKVPRVARSDEMFEELQEISKKLSA